jgi:predicted ATPase
MLSSKLDRIHIVGFRSIRNVTLVLPSITVVIGPNGSGKSNLLSVLRLIPLMRKQSLRRFVGEQGGASALLHYGASTTREMEFSLEMSSGTELTTYAAHLGYAAGDTLLFLYEVVLSGGPPKELATNVVSMGGGHAESKLADAAKGAHGTTLQLADEALGQMGFFHFHDTSPTSPLRQNSRKADDRELHSDGSNLAAFLYRLKTSDSEDAGRSWNLISGLVRRVAPFIKELVPDLLDPDRPDQSAVRLYWTDERDYRFDVHDLSDGTLRAIALFTALGQPAASRPQFITIDEPELGLHPAAVGIFAALVRSVSEHCQILLATQSPALLDEFEPEDVVVTERSNGETTFRRLDSAHLAAWLDDYSLSDLYDKNVLGGRP